MMNFIEKLQGDFNDMKTDSQARTACIESEKKLMESFENINNKNVDNHQPTPEEINEFGLKAIKDFEKSRRPQAMEEPKERYTGNFQNPSKQNDVFVQRQDEFER